MKINPVFLTGTFSEDGKLDGWNQLDAVVENYCQRLECKEGMDCMETSKGLKVYSDSEGIIAVEGTFKPMWNKENGSIRYCNGMDNYDCTISHSIVVRMLESGFGERRDDGKNHLPTMHVINFGVLDKHNLGSLAEQALKYATEIGKGKPIIYKAELYSPIVIGQITAVQQSRA